jgi:hypothetical protein
MLGVRWSTFLADANGVVDYVRVRALVAVLLAMLGGLATVWVVFLTEKNINEYLVGMMVAACVAPLTGGKIADVLSGRSKSAAISDGRQPGRRSSDAALRPSA